MITATEIRYGNWVQNQNGYPIRVNYHFFGMIERLGKDHSEACSGIPLTPEILEKRGFVKWEPQPRIIQWRWKEGELTAEIGDKGSIYISPADVYWIDVKYLHQLQNLIFVLTGEELNVKL